MVTREEFIASVLRADSRMTREAAERLADHDLPYDATIPRDGGDDASYQEWRKLVTRE